MFAVTLTCTFVLLSFLSLRQVVSDIPDDVQDILKTSCYDCHSSDAGNEDAKAALDFEKWDDYKVTKKISLLKEICELCEEEKMPPEGYLNHKPDNKLSEKQIKTICEWTTDETEKLMK